MDTVNNSAGLITSYHMLDAVVRGMFTPPAEVEFTKQLAVYCVLQLHHSEVLW